MLDHNVKKILEKGFSEEDAKQALRTTNNNLERALYNLKRRGEIKRAEENGNGNFKNTQASTFISAKASRGVPTREMGSGKRGGALAKEDAVVAKPAGNVSLFDFLTDKLSVDAESTSNLTNSTSTTNIPDESTRSNKFEKIKKEAPKPNTSEKKATENIVDSNSNALRPRFENTMSSSFAANRSTGPVNVQQKSERGNTNIRGGRSSNERVKNTSTFNPFKEHGNDCNNEIIRSSGGLPSSNNQNTNQGRNNRVSYERGKITNTSGGDLLESGISNYANKRGNEKQQQQRSHGGAERIGGHTENRSRFTNRRENSNQHQTNNSDSKNNSTTKSTVMQNSNASNASQINKLIEEASKLKISDPRRSPTTSGSATGEVRSNLQQSPTASQNFGPSQQTNQISAQTNNGYSYDTSKIIGFQNKKTNEFAMTLLKSQGLGSSKSALYTNLQQQPSSSHFQAPSQMNSYVAPTSDYSVPTPSTVSPGAPIPSHFGMVQGDGWHWKVGDLCFAKYWDDGRVSFVIILSLHITRSVTVRFIKQLFEILKTNRPKLKTKRVEPLTNV